MRIFLGLSEISLIQNELAKGLRLLGHQTQTVLWRRNSNYQDLDYDFIVDEHGGIKPESGIIERYIRRYAAMGHKIPGWIINNDVFIFIFADSMLPFYLDYPIIKLLGKKIISIFCGSDVRYWFAYQQEMEQLKVIEAVSPFLNAIKNRQGNHYYGDRFQEKLFRVRTAEKYSDLILAQPSFAQLFTRSYKQFNLPIELSGYGFNIPNREVPVILHSPSNRNLKGTTQILETIEQLTNEGLKFDFRFIENVSNTELRELLLDSDIVIDQLISAIIGKMALEGMATGNVVLGRYMPGYVHIPGECPMVNVDKFTLAENLREVIRNRDLRYQLAMAGRPYLEAYHSHIDVARKVIEWLEAGKISKYDYSPTFFRDHFKMDKKLQALENKQLLEDFIRIIFKRVM